MRSVLLSAFLGEEGNGTEKGSYLPRPLRGDVVDGHPAVGSQSSALARKLPRDSACVCSTDGCMSCASRRA